VNSYELSRNFFDWCIENPEKVTPNHVAIYMFSIEHCNRLGWKSKFGFPTQMAMDAVGIKNWRTYSKALNDLCEWGFVDMLEKSKNQYSSCIIAIVKNTKANTKALTKATQSHLQKQVNSIAVINKPNNNKPNNIEERKHTFATSLAPFKDVYGRAMLVEFYEYWSESDLNNKKMKFEMQKTFSVERRLKTWAKKAKEFGSALPIDEQGKTKFVWE